LNLNYTVTSKRKLKQLVDEKNTLHVGMIAGCRRFLVLRRRWLIQALSIRNFFAIVWHVTKIDSTVDVGHVGTAIREIWMPVAKIAHWLCLKSDSSYPDQLP